ncbi:ImmA/IrrE family metallo-endopeptidase [Thalassobacillus sp. CUG 92003]|uniref:ImmA/IrrE family metallo-endopeptidase n=1 Tax=Thalassobacillus sp. CUG 92003 TaxID=2736641 RepID=UPI0015E7DBBD|nr:ImmA/IrrE family metallo-endopeptidase [Thalassobacillus sp. CUG 92003]
MNFPQYTTTALEDWVSNWYIKRKFQYPLDLKLRKIAMQYEIFIHYKPMESRYTRFGRYREIVLNSTLNKTIQREQFFHELCHAVRHVGKQTMMPDAFRELQERDARHFTLYAALPYHMVKSYNLDDPDLLERWSQDFKVTEELCKERFTQICRRLQTKINGLNYLYL